MRSIWWAGRASNGRSNFEWSFGYGKRFGVIYVDYATQRRAIKDSGYWYAQVIAQNGIVE